MSVDSDDDLDFGDMLLCPLTDQPFEDDTNIEDSHDSSDESDITSKSTSTDEKEDTDDVSPIVVNAEKPPLPPHLEKRRRSSAVSLAIQIPVPSSFPKNANWGKKMGFGGSKNQVQWKRALKRVMSLDDPWEQFHINEYPTETCRRYRYNAIKKEWVTDMMDVKMEPKQFNRGAMRACFRLKKVVHGKCESLVNYVAKSYIEDVERDVYFEDVKLQSDAKLWAEEYSRHNPPKKVDIMQMACLEFINRDDKALYHAEHFIEGDYIKYNSNSGFVHQQDDVRRYTPQALSHFTFERSGHQLIVVDIQGVGDLYTDPQIHTDNGEGYGDGNLGPKGMALFFHSHTCNSICKSLNLVPFDLSPNELQQQEAFIASQSVAETIIRGNSIEYCQSPSSTERRDLNRMFRKRHNSRNVSGSSQEEEVMCTSPDPASGSPSSLSPGSAPDTFSPGAFAYFNGQDSLTRAGAGLFRRVRHGSECDCGLHGGSGTLTKEEDRLELMMSRRHRPSSVAYELNQLALDETDDVTGSSVLGYIHLDLAKYHELGRFNANDNETIDWDSAAFHLNMAAKCGILEAILTLARIYLNLPRDVLQGLVVPDTDENVDCGFDYMLVAAKARDRASMIYIAKAFETGVGLCKSRRQDWNLAIEWYQRVVGMSDGDESGMYDSTGDDPNFQLLAKQAELYRHGGHGLRKHPQRAGDLYNEAAEEAMASMRGKLATKFYMLAEECFGEVEEEDEEEEEEHGITVSFNIPEE